MATRPLCSKSIIALPEICVPSSRRSFVTSTPAKALRHGRARESGKKCLTENCADRQQENCKNEFHPTRRHCERIRYRNEYPRPCDIADNLPAAVGIALSAIVCRSSLSCSQSARRLRRGAVTKARLNRRPREVMDELWGRRFACQRRQPKRLPYNSCDSRITPVPYRRPCGCRS